MKSNLNKTIFMVLYCTSFLFLKANSQIIYGDINPDDSVTCYSTTSLICEDSLNLDINSDGTNDFKFRYTYHRIIYGSGMCTYYKLYRSCLVYPIGPNGIASDSARPLNIIYASSIDSSLIWTDTSASSNTLSYNYTKSISHCPPMSAASNIMSGNWFNHSDEYLGVYIIELGLKYYGWIRLSVITATQIIIKEYAYNSTPDEYILAGDSGSISSGIIYHSTSKSEFSVYPNPAKSNITVHSELPGELQLINPLGQIIFSQQMNERESHIDVSNFPPGIYVIRLYKNQTVQTKSVAILDW